MTPDSVRVALTEAVEWLHTEERLIEEEHRSFAAFETRVESIGPEPFPATANGTRTATLVRSTEPSRLSRVREAYRETVMAVSHYEPEYGDSLAESLETEFSPELAAVLARGSELTAPVYQQLRREVTHSRQNRANGRRLVAAERAALTEIRTTLEGISDELDDLDVCPSEQWTTDALLVGWDRLQDLRRQCDELATERQRGVQEYVREYSEFTAREGFEAYMYPTLPSNHPGLAAIAVVGDRIRATEDTLYEELRCRNGGLEALDATVSGLSSESPGAQRTRS